MHSSQLRRRPISQALTCGPLLVLAVLACGCQGPLQLPGLGENGFSNQELPPHLSAKHRRAPQREAEGAAVDATDQTDETNHVDAANTSAEPKLASAGEAAPERDQRKPLTRRIHPALSKSRSPAPSTPNAPAQPAEDEEGVSLSFSDLTSTEEAPRAPLADATGAGRTPDPVASASHQTLVPPTPASQPAAEPAPREPTAGELATETPASVKASENTTAEVRALAEQLRQKLQAAEATAHSSDNRIDLAHKQRLVSLILEDLEAAQQPIEELNPAAQDYIASTLQSLHEATDKSGNPIDNRRFTRALESHREAASSLARLANLELRNAAFCTEVESFGLVTRFANYQFQAAQQVLLYCEIENFVSRRSADGFETKLQGNYEIIDSRGRPVVDQLLPEDTDVCGNQRHDFYIAYRLNMPRNIKPGKYELNLVVEDMHGQKIGQTKIEFEIVP